MSKIKIPLGDNFEKETNRIHLRRFFPFVENDYRKIEDEELGSLEVLKELFGENEKELYKLIIVHTYQSI